METHKIIKAEVLWTRKCPLKCSYCNMATGQKNSMTLQDWQRGIDQLAKMGCQFIAFYGAEPLADFEKLPKVIATAEKEHGIPTTIITSGVDKDFEIKVDVLHSYGARSLSMSYDIVPLCRASKAKSDRALEGLRYFKSLGEYRDVAAIATLTRTNINHVIPTVFELSKEDIWFFFDLIHPDRGQPGSKCKNYPGLKDLLFREEDMPNLIGTLKILEQLKEMGYKVHANVPFLDHIRNTWYNQGLYKWNCAKENCFPSWVTVDCDGVVYACDDFQPPYEGIDPIMIYHLSGRWEEFVSYWKKVVKKNCPGCAWNTHIDAHAIKRGDLDISKYVHRS